MSSAHGQHCIIVYKEETNRIRPMSSRTNELVTRGTKQQISQTVSDGIKNPITFIVRTARRRAHAHREVGAPDAIDLDAGLHSQPFLVQAARVQRLSVRHCDGVNDSTRLPAAGIR